MSKKTRDPKADPKIGRDGIARHCNNPVRLEPARLACAFCGCVWKRPEATAADEKIQRLIDHAFLRGFRYGAA